MYDKYLSLEFLFENKEILACVPGTPELEYFFRGANRVISFDVRPVSWFDFQMDITNMKKNEDQSFDVFVAIAVMQHVEKDYLVPAEIYRVLRPG
ncbi:MAG: class I SAM-dependent methyltransferase [Chlorobiaceae bacterium]|nr:class I SAM-dependent methyltransferase [Chlorobiaceae bacterium]